MNMQDHLLTILIEECSEIQKIACKALRFGIEDINPATKKANKEELQHEINDLLTIVKRLGFEEDEQAQQKKSAKVDYWLNYSDQKGRLNERK